MGTLIFQQGLPQRGTGTATIEAKLAQQLAWMEQEPLYQVFVDLRKAYDHPGLRRPEEGI